jgi:hypothetical protein
VMICRSGVEIAKMLIVNSRHVVGIWRCIPEHRRNVRHATQTQLSHSVIFNTHIL